MSRAVVLRAGPVSRRTTVRALTVNAVLVLLVAGCALAALMLGDRPLTPGRVLAAFGPDANALDRLVVVEWRAPRAAAAVLFGACLGVSGAIFQSLTRNPLGSPDVVGLNTGAYTGVVTVLTLGGTGYAAQAGGALLGGLGATALVYLFAYRGGVHGFRFIVVGIAVSAMLSSVNTWLTVKADLDVAMRAAVWGAGGLNGVDWLPVTVSAAVAALLAPALPAAARWLRQLELGDDTAGALGVRTEAAKAALVVLGVALTALVTAATGPVTFVALAAPQIARRLTGHGGSVDLVGSALVGALLVSGADLVGQHAIPGTALPVGAVTVCLGGGYLLWLLVREVRRS
ncbi:FecCD family ABC transporter permease [Streptomyces sp. MS19]|uniref:FecCD family ABC transporter permease n=1 Tax=Streptomyces sp. MS19 TaxID=3385972 RepID=UPI0039A08E60